jgi:protein-S-isoprenylcysteine O-methyltransferase Ste14
MNAYRIGPVKYPWPTVFYILAIVVACGLQLFMPFHFPDEHMLLLQMAGCILSVIGVCLMTWASIMLFRNRTALLSNRSAVRLVIAGPFRYSRNPIYLGYTLLTLGAGVYADNGWIAAAALVAATATHLYVIRKEEMHLLARFGYEFERYCRRTRVWI